MERVEGEGKSQGRRKESREKERVEGEGKSQGRRKELREKEIVKGARQQSAGDGGRSWVSKVQDVEWVGNKYKH
jgi:hypothetical protein